MLAYLFHRIDGRLDGRPTLLIIDEGWLALDDERFAGAAREWLKTLRKKNASVIFATQSLSDIDGSAIAPAIIESCPTRLFLPNERAIEPQITAIYRRFGLNDRQIEILARATPEARLLLPVAARQPPVRAGPRSEVGARPLRGLVQVRPAAIDRVARRARPRRLPRQPGSPTAASLWAADLIPNLAKRGGHVMTVVRSHMRAALLAAAVLGATRACAHHLVNSALQRMTVFDPWNYARTS